MFTKMTIVGNEDVIEVTHKIVHRNGVVDYVQAFEAPDNRSVAIPARKQEIQLDFAKIAELQAWQKELLAKFGK